MDSGKDTELNMPLYLLQKWQMCSDASDGILVTLLIDLSKVYDCVNHNLIIEKLEAY